MSEERLSKTTPAQVNKGFSGISPEQAEYFNLHLLGLDALDSVKSSRQRLFKLTDLQGKSVVDLGCGNGLFAAKIAEAVGSSGRVIGIDSSPQLLEYARQRIEGSNLPVEFRCADVTKELPLNEGEADIAVIHRLLTHLTPSSVGPLISQFAQNGIKELEICDANWRRCHINGPDSPRLQVLTRKIAIDRGNPFVIETLPGLLNSQGYSVFAQASDWVEFRGLDEARFYIPFWNTLKGLASGREKEFRNIQEWIVRLLRVEREGEFYFGVPFETIYARRSKIPTGQKIDWKYKPIVDRPPK